MTPAVRARTLLATARGLRLRADAVDVLPAWVPEALVDDPALGLLLVGRAPGPVPGTPQRLHCRPGPADSHALELAGSCSPPLPLGHVGPVLDAVAAGRACGHGDGADGLVAVRLALTAVVLVAVGGDRARTPVDVTAFEAAAPDHWSVRGPQVLGHLNAGHAREVAGLAERVTGLPVAEGGAVLTAVDAGGVEVTRLEADGVTTTRVAFDRPVTCERRLAAWFRGVLDGSVEVSAEVERP